MNMILLIIYVPLNSLENLLINLGSYVDQCMQKTLDDWCDSLIIFESAAFFKGLDHLLSPLGIRSFGFLVK